MAATAHIPLPSPLNPGALAGGLYEPPATVEGPVRGSTSSSDTLEIDEKRSTTRKQKEGVKSMMMRWQISSNTGMRHPKTTTGKGSGSRSHGRDSDITTLESPLHQETSNMDSPSNHCARAPNRATTFWRAMHQLCTLDEREVDAFMDSYVIYSLDWKDEEAMRRALGDDFQQRVGDCLRAYYGVLNHLCALGDVEKMYIPPLMDRKVSSVRENQILYEKSIAEDVGLRSGMRVLDLGCGRGRVAAHMASFSGCQVTGLNIDPNQVAQARTFNRSRGLPNRFVEHDFNNLPLPFEAESFDAFYQIQALSLCRDHDALFQELHRVLKPGARLSILDWVSFPPYDPENEEHAELMRRVKPLIGAVGTPTPKSLEEALNRAGFVVVKSDNASVGGFQAPLIDDVDIYFRALRRLVLGLVKVKVLPPHMRTLINRLCLDGQAFVKMDRMGLVTTSYRIIAEKPLR